MKVPMQAMYMAKKIRVTFYMEKNIHWDLDGRNELGDFRDKWMGTWRRNIGEQKIH